MTCRSELLPRLPALRLRAEREQVICLLRIKVRPADPKGARLHALVASRRAPFLRRFRLYGPAAPPAPRRTPSAA
jgi:hypothetical protein